MVVMGRLLTRTWRGEDTRRVGACSFERALLLSLFVGVRRGAGFEGSVGRGVTTCV